MRAFAARATAARGRVTGTETKRQDGNRALEARDICEGKLELYQMAPRNLAEILLMRRRFHAVVNVQFEPTRIYSIELFQLCLMLSVLKRGCLIYIEVVKITIVAYMHEKLL